MNKEWNECTCCTRTKLHEHRARTIEFALDQSGVAQGLHFLNGVKKGKTGLLGQIKGNSKKVSNADKAQMLIVLQTYAATGKLIVPRQLNELGTREGRRLREFKAGNLRLPFYEAECQGALIARITHGFIKAGVKAPPKEISIGHGIAAKDRIQ